jgi:hypothetical protein
MKFTAMVLGSAFALSSTCAFAHTVRHKSNVRTHTVHKNGARSVVLRPKYGSPADNDRGWFHQTPPLTQSFDDPEGKNSGLPLN